MSLYDIYIPTYKRAGKVKTHLIFPNAHLVCPQNQLEEYKNAYPEMSIIPCPDEVEGNMARKRNWIKRYAEARGNYFIFIDDDIKGFQMLEGSKQIKMNKEQIDNMIINGFQMAEDLGTVLWGVNVNADRQSYDEYAPFNMLSVVLGPFTGHIKSSLRYDERLPTKEDYDYSLLVIRDYHKVLKFKKYSYVTEHLTNEAGGSISIRRMSMELDQNILLQKKWGSKVVKFDMKKSVNPTVKIPLKGI